MGGNFMKIILKSKYKVDKILLNYRCEENPPGSGNFKCDVNAQSDKDLDKRNKSRLKELKTILKETKTKNQAIRDQMDKLPLYGPEWKELQKKIDITSESKIQTYIDTLNYRHPDKPIEFKPIIESTNIIIKNSTPEEQEQLRLYVSGWGNAHYQKFLADNKGTIEDAAIIAKKQALRMNMGREPNPNNPFEMEYYNKNYDSALEYAKNNINSIKLLDSVMNKSIIPNDIVVQTGISSASYDTANLSTGDEFNLPTFISTSRSDVVANGFALLKFTNDKSDFKKNPRRSVEPTMPTVLEMHVKAGSRALGLEDFVLESQGPDASWVVGSKGTAGTGSQQEVLLARGTKCVVKDVQEITFRGKQIRKIIVDASN
jgi:hypothetical protein